jgi:hypothetical protein
MGSRLRRYLIAKELAMPQWFFGGFSNLGEWDPEKRISQTSCQGAWLFSPPVLSFQAVGAGCVTFQQRLSLVIQLHPRLTTSPAVPRTWINNWVKEIEMDLFSLHEESLAVPWLAA